MKKKQKSIKTKTQRTDKIKKPIESTIFLLFTSTLLAPSLNLVTLISTNVDTLSFTVNVTRITAEKWKTWLSIS